MPEVKRIAFEVFPYPNQTPPGVDFDGAKEAGVNAIWARSLPGKVAPLTAARVIQKTIYHILEEVPV